MAGRTLRMIEVIRLARMVSSMRDEPGQLPAPAAVLQLQAAAFEADGLPRLMSDLLACYTGTSYGQASENGYSRYRFLDHDLRLIKVVSLLAGFRFTQDMRWATGCVSELGEHARRITSGGSASTCGDAAELLHRLGRDHLVCGRLNPAELRSRLPSEAAAPHRTARLLPKAVGVLSAISRDAGAVDSQWTGTVEALTELGLSPGRARQAFTAVGPCIVNAAREMEVSPLAEMSGQVMPQPSVGDSAGVVLAICDLIALNPLCDD